MGRASERRCPEPSVLTLLLVPWVRVGLVSTPESIRAHWERLLSCQSAVLLAGSQRLAEATWRMMPPIVLSAFPWLPTHGGLKMHDNTTSSSTRALPHDEHPPHAPLPSPCDPARSRHIFVEEPISGLRICELLVHHASPYTTSIGPEAKILVSDVTCDSHGCILFHDPASRIVQHVAIARVSEARSA